MVSASYEGLPTNIARDRLEQFGENLVDGKRNLTVWRIFFSQFTSPLIYVLLVAGIISILLGHTLDASIILVAVIVNVLLGFYQEYRAEKSLEALEKVITVEVEVVRDGISKRIEMSMVVPGDLVILKMGDKVPADGVIIRSELLAVNESILTGESVAVEKIALNYEESIEELDWNEIGGKSRAYMGTTVVAGLAKMIVMKTGKSTEVGKIADKLIETRREKTVLQKKLADFAKLLTWIVLTASGILLLVGVLRGENFSDVFLVAVAVAVSAIPEGLVVALTAILAVGMQRILRRKGLVRRLLAAEALGSVTVVCADKTGTLTRGEMSVVNFEGDQLGLARAAILSNDMSDPLENAMMKWGQRNPEIKKSKFEINGWERVGTLPFNPSLKFAVSVSKKGSSKQFIVRGAPEVLLRLSNLTRNQKKKWRKRFDELTSNGYRIVGYAKKEDKWSDDYAKEVLRGGIEWIGILIFEDPVRADVASEIQKLKKAKIDFKVITGDFAGTAKYVMSRLGIEVRGRLIEGEKFRKLSAKDQKIAVRENVLFARFSPEEKLRVVEILQRQGEVVAMMGDGVNDAPALKKADVGVVVSGASEVSKETADMVLLDDHFATIVEGVEEGRGIFENIRKVVLYLLSDSFSEIILVFGSMLLGLPLPLTAAQILWVNLANDSLPALALTLEPLDDGLMDSGPRSRKESLLDEEMRELIVIISLFTGVYVLAAFAWLLNKGYSVEYARTIAFLFLGLDSLLYVFVARSLEKPLWKINIFSNIWLLIGVLFGLGMQLAVLYIPKLQELFGTHTPTGFEWAIVFMGSVFLIVTIESVKWAWNQKRKT